MSSPTPQPAPPGDHEIASAAARENARRIFDSVDVNKDGSLDFDELQRAFQSSGIKIDDAQIHQMIDVADDNKNHTIEFEEFYKFAAHSQTHTLGSISEYWLQYSTKPIIRATGAPAWKLLVAGGVAGAVSRTATSPLERLKILNQVRGVSAIGENQYQGVVRSLVSMYQKEGWRGFFKGNGTNVVRIAPYSAIQFASYEKYKKTLLKGQRAHMTPYENLLAGGAAGVTSLLCTYPLDLIRSRLTIQTTEMKYTGMGNAFSTVIKEEGYLGLYKGMFTSILGVAPYVAINFTTYETLKQHFEGSDGSTTVLKSLAFGAISGATAQTLTYPIDLLRRRLQLQGIGGQPVKYTGTYHALSTIIRDEGVLALYRGMIPCYLKVVPAISISFCVYEIMRFILGIQSRKVSFSSG